MNRFIESNKPWLSLLGLTIIILFLAFLFRPKSPEYQTGKVQAIKIMIDPQNQVVLSDLPGKQLIDIRSSELFAQGHIRNAISIPVRNLLDNESLELFDRLLKNGQSAVLYGSNELQATAPCQFLQQMGYKNIKLLKGGLAINGEFNETAQPSSEVSVLDKTALMVKPEGNTASETKTDKKNTESVTHVKKAVSSGGGC